MPDTYRLIRRDGGVYYYFRRVPTSLVPAVGKRFIKKSLGTTDKAEAKKRRTIEDLKSDALFEQYAPKSVAQPKPSAPNPVSAQSLLSYLREAVVHDDERTRSKFAADPPDSEEQLDEMRRDAEYARDVLGLPDHPDRAQQVWAFAKVALRDAPANHGADQSPEFLELVRQALLEIYRRKLALYDDEHDRTFFNPLFDPARADSRTFSAVAKAYLDVKFEEYAANAVSDKRRDKVAAIIDTLVEMVGAHVPAASVNYETADQVRGLVAALPSRRTTIYPGLSVRDAIARAEKDGRSKLSPTSQRTYLDEFAAMLRFAKKRKIIADNPAEGIKPLKKATVAAEDLRKPFTINQLQTFFRSLFYRGCSPDISVPYEGKDREWRFWMPLIMLFSGARPNEIAQLKVHHVRLTDVGTNYFDFTNEAQAGDPMQLKTGTSRRRIPIHAELVRIGILDFVAARKHVEGANAWLFPTLTLNSYGNRAWYPVKRFNEKFLPSEMGLTDRQSLYSFRHCVRDALRRIEASPEVLQAIGGWAPSTKAVSDHYGDPKNPDLWDKWVQAIAYPGLSFKHLYVVER